MAATYDTVSSQTVTEIISPTETAERLEIWSRAKPSDVVFAVRLAPILLGDGGEDEIIAFWADFYNTIASWTRVTNVAYVQDIGFNNELVDKVLVEVRSENGQFTTQREYNLLNLQLDWLNQELTKVALDLDKLQAL